MSRPWRTGHDVAHAPGIGPALELPRVTDLIFDAIPKQHPWEEWAKFIYGAPVPKLPLLSKEEVLAFALHHLGKLEPKVQVHPKEVAQRLSQEAAPAHWVNRSPFLSRLYFAVGRASQIDAKPLEMPDVSAFVVAQDDWLRENLRPLIWDLLDVQMTPRLERLLLFHAKGAERVPFQIPKPHIARIPKECPSAPLVRIFPNMYWSVDGAPEYCASPKWRKRWAFIWERDYSGVEWETHSLFMSMMRLLYNIKAMLRITYNEISDREGAVRTQQPPPGNAFPCSIKECAPFVASLPLSDVRALNYAAWRCWVSAAPFFKHIPPKGPFMDSLCDARLSTPLDAFVVKRGNSLKIDNGLGASPWMVWGWNPSRIRDFSSLPDMHMLMFTIKPEPSVSRSGPTQPTNPTSFRRFEDRVPDESRNIRPEFFASPRYMATQCKSFEDEHHWLPKAVPNDPLGDAAISEYHMERAMKSLLVWLQKAMPWVCWARHFVRRVLSACLGIPYKDRKEPLSEMLGKNASYTYDKDAKGDNGNPLLLFFIGQLYRCFLLGLYGPDSRLNETFGRSMADVLAILDATFVPLPRGPNVRLSKQGWYKGFMPGATFVNLCQLNQTSFVASLVQGEYGADRTKNCTSNSLLMRGVIGAAILTLVSKDALLEERYREIYQWGLFYKFVNLIRNTARAPIDPKDAFSHIRCALSQIRPPKRMPASRIPPPLLDLHDRILQMYLEIIRQARIMWTCGSSRWPKVRALLKERFLSQPDISSVNQFWQILLSSLNQRQAGNIYLLFLREPDILKRRPDAFIRPFYGGLQAQTVHTLKLYVEQVGQFPKNKPRSAFFRMTWSTVRIQDIATLLWILKCHRDLNIQRTSVRDPVFRITKEHWCLGKDPYLMHCSCCNVVANTETDEGGKSVAITRFGPMCYRRRSNASLPGTVHDIGKGRSNSSAPLVDLVDIGDQELDELMLVAKDARCQEGDERDFHKAIQSLVQNTEADDLHYIRAMNGRSGDVLRHLQELRRTVHDIACPGPVHLFRVAKEKLLQIGPQKTYIYRCSDCNRVVRATRVPRAIPGILGSAWLCLPCRQLRVGDGHLSMSCDACGQVAKTKAAMELLTRRLVIDLPKVKRDFLDALRGHSCIRQIMVCSVCFIAYLHATGTRDSPPLLVDLARLHKEARLWRTRMAHKRSLRRGPQ